MNKMILYNERAETYDLCIMKIEKLHGKAYEIMQHREILESGFWGFRKKRLVEVSYRLKTNMFSGFSDNTLSPKTPAVEISFEQQKRQFLENTGRERNEPMMAEIKKVQEEMNELRKSLSSKTDEHQTITQIRNVLVKNDFSYNYIGHIEELINSELTVSELSDIDHVKFKVFNWIAEDIKINPVDRYQTKPHIMGLVGPTGIGKTTTIAKIAARLITAEKEYRSNSVAMITIDLYRIGAKDQLATYGEIMQTPVFMVDNPEDMRKTVDMCSDSADIILIDTIGKSPKDYKKLSDMKTILSPLGNNIDIHLAVSATTKFSDLDEIFRQFEPFAYRSVIITKLDETERVGNLISILYEKGKSLSYLTDGQSVHTGLQPASTVGLLNKLDGFSVELVKYKSRQVIGEPSVKE